MKTIVVDIAPKNLDAEELAFRLDEVENLANTYGSLVVVRKVQKRDSPDYRTYLWSWKLEEIYLLATELWVDLIIIGNILKPSQIYQINEYFREKKSNIQAWDRVDLILKIFQLHAKSPEARLQIELASIRHMGPRIFGMGMELSKQWGGSSGGGSGMRGKGETNTEIMKRHLRQQELKIVEQLEKYEKTRAQHRQARSRKGLKTVGIVGYTNAGKSSLMNVFTHKGVLAEDKLFATLGTSVGKMWLPALQASKITNNESLVIPSDPAMAGEESFWQEWRWVEILVNDTIGFIRDLPPQLIKAFSSTLEDSIESDLLLHVIDISDPKIEEKIQVVEDILLQIGAKQERLYVFNKTDMLSSEQIESVLERFSHLQPICISAHQEKGMEELKKRIRDALGV